MSMKLCKRCNTEKPLDDFGRDKRKPDGRKYLCRTCHNAANTRLRTAKPEGHRVTNLAYARSERGRALQRANSLRRKYWPHLTNDQAVGEYDRLLSLQNDACGLCKRHKSVFKKALAVDHCHKTKQVRGLLCAGCNRTEVAHRTYEQVRAILDYLTRFQNKVVAA